MHDAFVDRGERRVLRDLTAERDERLAGLVSAGDRPAFAELVRRHRPALIGYARRLAPTDAGAEDAVQQAFLQAWVAFQRDEPEIRDVRAWLFRTVHNATISGLRRPRCEPLDSATTAESRSADVEYEARLAVREAFAGLAALPELQRNVMLSTAVDGDSHEQIAATYGITKGAVRGLIYRARTSLRAAAAAVTPAPIINWLARHRPIGSVAGETLVGAGSAGVAGGALKSGMIVAGIAATTGGIGIAVVTATHDHDGRRTVHHAHYISASPAPTRAADPNPRSSVTAPTVGRASSPRIISASSIVGRGNGSADHTLSATRARGKAARVVASALRQARSSGRAASTGSGGSGSEPGDRGRAGSQSSGSGSEPGDGTASSSGQSVYTAPSGGGSSASSSPGSDGGDASGSGSPAGAGSGSAGGTSAGGGSASGTDSGSSGGGSGAISGGTGSDGSDGSGGAANGANSVVGSGSGSSGTSGTLTVSSGTGGSSGGASSGGGESFPGGGSLGGTGDGGGSGDG